MSAHLRLWRTPACCRPDLSRTDRIPRRVLQDRSSGVDASAWTTICLLKQVTSIEEPLNSVLIDEAVVRFRDLLVISLGVFWVTLLGCRRDWGTMCRPFVDKWEDTDAYQTRTGT